MSARAAVLHEGDMELHVFGGGPEQVGRAQGALELAYVREELQKRLDRPHTARVAGFHGLHGSFPGGRRAEKP